MSHKSLAFILCSLQVSRSSLDSSNKFSDAQSAAIADIERQIARLQSPRRFNLVAQLAPQYRLAMVRDAHRLQEEYIKQNMNMLESVGVSAHQRPDYLRREQAILQLNPIIKKYDVLIPTTLYNKAA